MPLQRNQQQRIARQSGRITGQKRIEVVAENLYLLRLRFADRIRPPDIDLPQLIQVIQVRHQESKIPVIQRRFAACEESGGLFGRKRATTTDLYRIPGIQLLRSSNLPIRQVEEFRIALPLNGECLQLIPIGSVQRISPGPEILHCLSLAKRIITCIPPIYSKGQQVGIYRRIRSAEPHRREFAVTVFHKVAGSEFDMKRIARFEINRNAVAAINQVFPLRTINIRFQHKCSVVLIQIGQLRMEHAGQR